MSDLLDLLRQARDRIAEDDKAWERHMNRFHAPRTTGPRAYLLSQAWWDCCPRSAPYGDTLLDELNEALAVAASDGKVEGA